MNLIDFHVTKVLGQPVKRDAEWGTYYKLEVEFSDDGGDGQIKTLTSQSLDFLKSVKPGYVGQH